MRSSKTKELGEISGVEKPVCEFARGNGWLVRKVACIGRRGFPDRFFVKDGRVVLVEFKRPKKTAGVQQAREHNRLRKHGIEVYVIDDPEAGYAIFA